MQIALLSRIMYWFKSLNSRVLFCEDDSKHVAPLEGMQMTLILRYFKNCWRRRVAEKSHFSADTFAVRIIGSHHHLQKCKRDFDEEEDYWYWNYQQIFFWKSAGILFVYKCLFSRSELAEFLAKKWSKKSHLNFKLFFHQEWQFLKNSTALSPFHSWYAKCTN